MVPGACTRFPVPIRVCDLVCYIPTKCINASEKYWIKYDQNRSSKFWNSKLGPRLWLQGDNCPKEVRNSFTGKWMCLMTQANFFVSAAHHHMVVGHTHEDIGWDRVLTIQVLLNATYKCKCLFIVELIYWSAIQCANPSTDLFNAQMAYSPWWLLRWMPRVTSKHHVTSRGHSIWGATDGVTSCVQYFVL